MADHSENTITNCPQCPKHCPITEPHCGRGRAYVEELNRSGYDIKLSENADSGHSHGEHGDGKHGDGNHGHGEHGHEGHGRDEHGSREHRHGAHGHDEHRGQEAFDPDSLYGMMRRIGHRLFHGGSEDLFNKLTEQEQNTLKDLLGKMLKDEG